MTICVTPHEFFEFGHGVRAHTGILLIHGLTGTPNEMRLLGRGLQRAGFTVYGMQLAGHCGTHDDLINTGWRDWAASVTAATLRLQTQVERVIVIGLSMGAVLALNLAAQYPDIVLGVGSLSTMFWHDGWSMPFYSRFSFVLRPIRALGLGRKGVFLEQPPYGIKDETLRSRVVKQMQSGDSVAAGLPGNPWYSVVEMYDLSAHVQRRLDQICTPCLVMHASQDDVSSQANADLVVNKVQGPVELVLLHDSYHMITIDRERRLVIQHVVDFATRLTNLALPPTALAA